MLIIFIRGYVYGCTSAQTMWVKYSVINTISNNITFETLTKINDIKLIFDRCVDKLFFGLFSTKI